MSASQGSQDWYQTNAALADYSSNERNPRPRWAVDISRRLEISMPKQMLARAGVKALGLGGDDDDDENDGGNVDDEEEEDDDDDDDDADEDEEYDSPREATQRQEAGNANLDGDDDEGSGDSDDSGRSGEPGRPSNGKPQTHGGQARHGGDDDDDDGEGGDEASMPDAPSAEAGATKDARKPGALKQVETSDNVHLWRARLFGVALSPGGGCSAAVWAKTAAAVAERGAWHQARSTVSFDFRPPAAVSVNGNGDGEQQERDDPRLTRLSTEARVFECMYGRGPAVPGVTGPAEAEGGPAAAEMRRVFGDMVAGAQCPYCKGALSRNNGGRYFACPRKHFFGMHIQESRPA